MGMPVEWHSTGKSLDDGNLLQYELEIKSLNDVPEQYERLQVDTQQLITSGANGIS